MYRFKLTTWTTDGIETLPLTFDSKTGAYTMGWLYMQAGCLGYRVERVR